MITIELNAKDEPCERCGRESSVCAKQSLFSEASGYFLTLTLFCVKCGEQRIVTAKVEVADMAIRPIEQMRVAD